jgi:hypothetical protein
LPNSILRKRVDNDILQVLSVVRCVAGFKRVSLIGHIAQLVTLTDVRVKRRAYAAAIAEKKTGK